jgi:CheY-like chemotaxis protein
LPSLKVIVVSGALREAADTQAAEARVDAVLHKPFSLALLLQTVSRAIASDSGQAVAAAT